jgi:hypothetical protein
MAGVRLVVVSLALVAVASGCSAGVSGQGSARSSEAVGSGSGSRAASSAGASAGASAQPQSSGSAPDASTLPALVVQAGDVPGYTGDGTGGPQSKSDSDDPEAAKCMGQPDPNQYFLAGYASDEFSNDTVSIDSNVTSYSSSNAISIDRAYIADPTKLAACFIQEASAPDSGLPSGTTIGAASVLPAPAGAPSNVLGVISLQATTPGSGQPVAIYLDEALVVGADVDESVTFTSLGAPVPSSLLQSLTTTIANRISAK